MALKLGVNLRTIPITSDYSATLYDDQIDVDATLGPVTVTLPDSTLIPGKQIVINKVDSSANAVTVTGTQLMNSYGSNVIRNQYDFITATSGNTLWFIFGTRQAPTFQQFLSGSGTYSTPVGVFYLEVEMVGGGAGGAGGGTVTSAGGDGGPTTFGSSFLSCDGGAGGVTTGGYAGGGYAAGGDINVRGGMGSSFVSNGYAGGLGGISFFGGNGSAGTVAAGPISATGYGSGGGGGAGSSGNPGGGGGAGGYLRKIIYNPLATYSYSVGSAGAGGSGNGQGGGGGLDGVIFVKEYYQ
jgi:hypothetical protein